MNILYVDFETYYSKEFGFSKLTTEEYIRDPRFEVIGVAVQRNKEAPVWFSGTHDATAAFLRTFDWEDSIAVAHNAKFDMAILSWCFDIRPYKIADTLSMARAKHSTEVGGSLAALSEHYGLGVKGTEVLDALGKRRLDFTPQQLQAYGEYCCNDVVLTSKLFARLLHRFPAFELSLIDLTVRMFTEPVLELDIPMLQQHLQAVRTRREELTQKVTQDPKMLRSNPQFAQLLRQYAVEPPMKTSLTTGKQTYALAKTDEGFRALLEHENEYVQALAAARLGVKSTLEETRTERFIQIAQRGALPIPLRYYAARTGRWGGDELINMQNLPRGSTLKHAIRAPAGYMFVDCDLSQIEARVLAWLAQQDDLVNAFARGDDVYKIMASAIYGKPQEEISKGERFVGKTTILGCGYGMGAAKFQAQLKNFGVEMPLEECERIIHVYRATYPNIPQLWKQAGDALLALMQGKTAPLGLDGVLSVEGGAGIRLPNGLYIQYPNLRKVKNDEGNTELVYDMKKGRATIPNKIYGGKNIENICQALARIVVGEHMLLVAKKYKVVMTVHDAIGCVVPENEAEEGLQYVENCMRVRPQWASTLPLNCEGKVAKSYGGD